jgi:hypothetical protein
MQAVQLCHDQLLYQQVLDIVQTSHVMQAMVAQPHQSVLIVETEQLFHEHEQHLMERVHTQHDSLEVMHNVEFEMM